MRPANGEHCCRCLVEVHRVISRHITSEGLVVYSRCGCGALHMQLIDEPALVASSTPAVSQGRHAG